MNLLEWSRHHRCFPGQGTLDVTGVVAATLVAGLPRSPLARGVQRRGPRDRPRGHRTGRDAVAGLPRGRAVARRTRAGGAGQRGRSCRRAHRRRVPRARLRTRRRPRRQAARRARFRDGRATPLQARHVVAQRRGPRRRQRGGERVRREPRVRARPVRAAGRGRRGPGAGAALARGGHHPRDGRGDAPGDRVAVRSARLRQRHRRTPTTTGRATSCRRMPSAPALASGLDHVVISVSPLQLNEEMAFFRTVLRLRARSARGVHGAARPAAQHRAATGRGRRAHRPQRHRGVAADAAPARRHPGGAAVRRRGRTPWPGCGRAGCR